MLYVVGRLKEDVPPEAARADLAAISRRLSIADKFSTTGGHSARITPLVDHYLGTCTRQAFQALAVASACVLLLACANVVVLLLVQAIRKRTDLAVRRALGARGARVVLDQLLDNALSRARRQRRRNADRGGHRPRGAALGPADVPGLADVRADGHAFAMAFVAAAPAAVVMGLAPAWIGSQPAQTLRTGGAAGGLDRRGFAITRLLVTCEIARSIVLLVGCGLMVRSLQNLLKIDLGFVPARALTFSVRFPEERYPTTAASAFYRALLEPIAALPGVEAAGAVHDRPLEDGPIGSDNWVLIEGQPLNWDSVSKDSISVDWEAATPDYFRAVGTRLVEGRTFSAGDVPEAPKVVVPDRHPDGSGRGSGAGAALRPVARAGHDGTRHRARQRALADAGA